jgi:hypothetical protein
MLVRVQGRRFTAGLVMDNERCTEAAPILRWAIGLTREELRDEFESRGWTATVVRAAAELPRPSRRVR